MFQDRAGFFLSSHKIAKSRQGNFLKKIPSPVLEAIFVANFLKKRYLPNTQPKKTNKTWYKGKISNILTGQYNQPVVVSFAKPIPCIIGSDTLPAVDPVIAKTKKIAMYSQR